MALDPVSGSELTPCALGGGSSLGGRSVGASALLLWCERIGLIGRGLGRLGLGGRDLERFGRPCLVEVVVGTGIMRL